MRFNSNNLNYNKNSINNNNTKPQYQGGPRHMNSTYNNNRYPQQNRFDQNKPSFENNSNNKYKKLVDSKRAFLLTNLRKIKLNENFFLAMNMEWVLKKLHQSATLIASIRIRIVASVHHRHLLSAWSVIQA